MKFTDDDLKRLKEVLLTGNNLNPWRVEFRALLARLEASEWALQGFIRLEQEKENYDEVCSRVKAWRKACGK